MRTSCFLKIILCILIFSAVTRAENAWISVRSENFNLVGNADENSIRRVADRLEQFREAFRQLFPNLTVKSRRPTTVVVFKDKAAYKPYLPVLADGQPDWQTAGYFQSGRDVNYITLSVEGDDSRAFALIFHEYTHSLINNELGQSNVPPWFNEGIAEYYETFQMETRQRVRIGQAQDYHPALLRAEPLIPLEKFFAIDNETLLNSGNHARSMFYAEAWALIHYCYQDQQGLRRRRLDAFLQAVLNHRPVKESFEEAFGMNYAQLEANLKSYLERKHFDSTVYVLKGNPETGARMRVTPLSEAESLIYLGDLLLHRRRFEEAEIKLKRAVELAPQLAAGFLSLGAAQAEQRHFTEARRNLEKALTLDPKNYLAYYNYAFALSRETIGEDNLVVETSNETAEKMRAALNRAAELNPDFPETFHLLGFAALLSDQNFEEGELAVKKALQLEPGNQNHLLVLAQLYARQHKFAEAEALLAKIETAGDISKARAAVANLVQQLKERDAILKKLSAERAERAKAGEKIQYGVDPDALLPPEEAMNKAINQALRKPEAGEMHILGFLTEIDCEDKRSVFTVRSGTQTLKLRIDDLLNVRMVSYTTAMLKKKIGCGARTPENLVVATFRPEINSQTEPTGEIISLEFMPDGFELLP